MCCNNLGGVVHWEVLDRRDEALSNQLAVGRRSFSLHKVRLHLSHLGLESSARETKVKGKTDAEHLQRGSRFRKRTHSTMKVLLLNAIGPVDTYAEV